MSSVRFFVAMDMIATSTTDIFDYISPYLLWGSCTLGAGLLITVCLMTQPPDHLVDGHVLADREELEYAKRMIAA